MQPNAPYIPQPRFSPRDNRQRFPHTPYPRASPRFHQPWSSTHQHSLSAQPQWSPQSPNQEFYSLSQESPSSDSNVLDKGYIPLNLSGNSGEDGSPFKQTSSPRPYGDYNYHHRPNFRGSYNNRRPWSGGPRRSNFHDHRKNWSPRENNYSPNRGTFMQTVDVKQYISAEFLKDPWKHLSIKDSPDSTAPNS